MMESYWKDLFVYSLCFLLGGLTGTLMQQLAILIAMFEHKDLPWRTQSKLARYFGYGKWADASERVEKAERAVFATILIGVWSDLGGSRLLTPKSKDGFEGMLVEAERRYAESRKRRKI